MNTVKHVDVAIIGAGSAGMRAYREVTRYTDSVVLIEGGPYGTMCARTGCMPSKLLIAAAEAAHLGQRTSAFGVHYEPPRIDSHAVMQRVKSERDRFVGFVIDSVEGWPEEHRIKGYAQFVSDHRLRINDGTFCMKWPETPRYDRLVRRCSWLARHFDQALCIHCLGACCATALCEDS